MQVSVNTHYHLSTISMPSRRRTQKVSPSFTCKTQTNPSTKTEPLPLVRPTFPPESFPPTTLNPVQKLAASALDLVEKMVIKMEKTNKLNRMTDPAIQLEGNFAPVQEFPVKHDLEVGGTIPSSVHGVYLRNGANPLLPPTGGHHLFDGDGMIHAVSLEPENQVSYCCRFTRTNRLVREAELRKSVFPKPIGELHGHIGLARLALFGARSLVGVLNAADGAGVANAGLTYFNNRLLAISEDDLPYHIRITSEKDLETVQRYNFDGQLKDALIAHPKVDPTTGDLYSLSYNVISSPHLKFFKFDMWGNKLNEVDISLKAPTMIHDFAITDSYVVIPNHQMEFKLCEMLQGRSPVVHNPKKVPRFGVMSKSATNDSAIQWIDVPGWFGFHVYNAWEEYNEDGNKVIVVINSRMSPPDSIFTGSDVALKSELCEVRLNLKTGESTQRVIVSGMNLEAGQMNKQLIGKKTRYVYLAIADPWPKCSGIGKVDLVTGDLTTYMYGGQKYGGEPCFVPAGKDDKENEKEGFLMTFLRDEKGETSEFVILKASNMELVAIIKLPTRVPYGIHGTFVSAQELSNQFIE